MADELKGQIGMTFTKNHHGIRTNVILLDVLRSKVLLQCPEREDRFKITIAEFQKKYQLAKRQVA